MIVPTCLPVQAILLLGVQAESGAKDVKLVNLLCLIIGWVEGSESLCDIRDEEMSLSRFWLRLIKKLICIKSEITISVLYKLVISRTHLRPHC